MRAAQSLMAYPQPTLPESQNSAGSELQTPLGKAWLSSAIVVSKSRPFSSRKAAGSFSNAAEEGGLQGLVHLKGSGL